MFPSFSFLIFLAVLSAVSYHRNAPSTHAAAIQIKKKKFSHKCATCTPIYTTELRFCLVCPQTVEWSIFGKPPFGYFAIFQGKSENAVVCHGLSYLNDNRLSNLINPFCWQPPVLVWWLCSWLLRHVLEFVRNRKIRRYKYCIEGYTLHHQGTELKYNCQIRDC